MPAATPVTTPDELTVAIVELLVVQLPPDGVPVKVIVEPVQTVVPPDMEATALTVTV